MQPGLSSSPDRDLVLRDIALPARRQVLFQRVASVPAGEIIQDPEHDVAELLVECWCLEAERLQASVAAASPHGLALGSREEKPAATAAANPFVDPQGLDQEPSPVRAPDQASNRGCTVMTAASWVGDPPTIPDGPAFKRPARCTSPGRDWQGPKN